MEEKIKSSGLAFALKMQREDEPWEHRDRAVYTVESLKEEMTARLRPAPVHDKHDEKNEDSNQ
jgi:hypothetical protein